MEVKGRNLAEGIPRSFTISSNEILEALTEPLNQIVSRGEDRRSSRRRPSWAPTSPRRAWCSPAAARCCATSTACSWKRPGLPVIVADDPLTCVVRGSGKALEKMDKLGTIFTND